MYQFNFEKLQVWKNSRVLTKNVYDVTSGFPESEKFGITNQLRRCAVSICSNIAEGAARLTQKDQRHFYNIAYSSRMECLNQLIIAQDLDYLTRVQLDSFRK